MRRLFALVTVFVLSVTPVLANTKVALVIGNSNYVNVSELANPKNDAEAVAAELERQGFDVTVGIDLDVLQMNRALIRFRSKADASDIAMVYYAGHGIEVAGQNFLIPVDARLADERDAQVEATSLDAVLRQISGARKMRMIVLDACRDNPFINSMSGPGGRTRNVGRGLTRVEPDQSNTLIAYAAAEGAITPDGDPGGNSPFTSAFLTAMQDQPRDVRLMFGAVRDEMRKLVGPQVEPFVYASLGADQMIINPKSGVSPQVVPGGANAGEERPTGGLITDDLASILDLDLDLGMGGTGGDRDIDPAPAPKREATRGDIIRVQNLLLDLDEQVGTPDGYMNPATVAALKKFQRANRLPVTGEIDDGTIASLDKAAKEYLEIKAERERLAREARIRAEQIEREARERAEQIEREARERADRLATAAAAEAERLARLKREREEQAEADRLERERRERERNRFPPSEVAMIGTAIPGARGKRPFDEVRDCRFCPEMVVMPAGAFAMGSPPGEAGRDKNEGPQRWVRVTPVALAKTEVTFDQWQACVNDGGCRSNRRPDDSGFGRGDLPVINVSWRDAQEYITWLNSKVTGNPYRLPTEAEWEWAARASTTGPFSFSGPITVQRANYNGTHSYNGSPTGRLRNRTVRVDELEANPWGLKHMHGNVWEWVQDCWHPSYNGAPNTSRAWLSENGGDCSKRVLRSGSYFLDPRYLRSAARIGLDVAHRSKYRGFRPAKEIMSPGAAPLPDTAAEVREAQTLLADLGFDPGPSNGTLSRKTVDALVTFQRRTDGIAATGTVNRQTLEALRRAQQYAMNANPPRGGGASGPPSGPIPGTRYMALDKFKECRFCPEMVAIPAGSFTMGSPPSEPQRLKNEGPQHARRVAAFAMARDEVTFDDWQACVNDGGCRSNPRPDDAGFGRGDRPVINVSWNDAKQYIAWLNSEVSGSPYRLPTEAEWEYAARAGTTGPFSFSGPITTSKVNYNGQRSYQGSPKGPLRNRTVAVDELNSENPWGLRHMHGNVWEWMEDCWHADYNGAPADGRAWLTANRGDCSKRVLRSGSYFLGPQYLRSAARIGLDVNHRSTYRGLRPARTLN